MSLYGALFSGVSGLQSQSSAMGAISDNVANVNTVGYKGTKVNFQTLVTAQVSLTQYSPGGVQSAPRAGVDVQGLLQATTSSTDFGLSGQGFFVVSDEAINPAGYAYSRAGSFKVDKDGFLQNVAGYYLQGWPLQTWDGTATAATVTYNNDTYMKAYNNDSGETYYINDNAVDSVNMQPLNLNTIGGTARASSGLSIGANLPAGAENGSTEKTNALIFDSLGNSHNLNYTWIKRAENSWDVEVTPPAGSTYVSMKDQTTTERIYYSAGRLDFNSIPASGENFTMTINGNEYTFNFGTTDQNLTDSDSVAAGANNMTVDLTDATWNFSGDFSELLGQTIEIDGTVYEFTDGTGASGTNTEVDISADTTVNDALNSLDAAAGAGDITAVVGTEITLGGGIVVNDVSSNDWNAVGTVTIGGVAFTLSSNPSSDRDIDVGGMTTSAEIVTALADGAESYFDERWGAGNWMTTAVTNGDLGTSLTVDARSGVIGTPGAVEDFGTARHFAIDVTSKSLSQVLDQLGRQINTAMGREYLNTKSELVPQAYAERVAGESSIIFRQPDTTNDIVVDAEDFLDDDGLSAVMQSTAYRVPALDTSVAWTDPDSYAITFNGDGTPDTFFGSDEVAADDPRSSIHIGWANGALNMDGSDTASGGSPAITQFFGNYNTADGLQQLSGDYQLNYVTQNGNRFGNFTGVSVSETGIVTALFDNGVQAPIFMIPVATFVNPNGMGSLTGNVFQQTDTSGLPVVREAGSAGAGTVAQATLEASTVDLGEEFTTMITTQRAYSAAAKIITTSDDMLEELIRIKR